MNGDFLIQTHCTEIRRQVQLAKETSIQKIEELTEQLIDRINIFECESLDTLLKTDKDQFISKLNQCQGQLEGPKLLLVVKLFVHLVFHQLI